MKTETASPRPWKLHRDGIRDAEQNCVGEIYGMTEEDEAFMFRAVNAHDAMVEALERVSNGISDNSTLVYSAVEHCQRHNTSEPMVGVLELRRVVATALALAKEGKIEKGKQ